MDSSNKPRVLHLIDTGGPGGAETVFLALATAGERRSANAAVVVPYDGWLAGQLRERGIQPTVIAAKGSLNLGLLWRIVALARQRRANLIHAHLLGSSVYASAAGRLLNLSVVAVFHGATDLQGPGTLNSIKRWLLNRPHVTPVAVSEAVRDALVRWGIPATRIRLVLNGVDTRVFKPGPSRTLRDELGLPPNARLAGAVGNLRPAKDYDVLIAATHALVKQIPAAHVVISGSGTDAEAARLKALAREQGVADRVHLAGFRPSTAERYQSLDAFVSSARSEGLPLSFLEAMACGVPIAATANEGAEPLIRETRAGLLSPVGDSAALAQNLAKLLADPALRSRLGTAGRAAVEARFSLERTQTAYGALYDELLGSGKTG